MKKPLLFVIALVLTSVYLTACGDDSDTTRLLSEVAPTVAPVSTPTAAPTSAPTPTPTRIHTPAPTATSPAESTSRTQDGVDLPADCVPAGTLDDAATVSSCNAQAMMQVESFSFDVDFNLFAILPLEDTGEGFMRLDGSIVLPDRFTFDISLGPEGETIQMSGVIVGSDTYIKDPESEQWYKGSPPDSEFLAVVQIVGMLHLPNEVDPTLSELVDLGDGDRAYALVSNQTGQGSGIGGPRFPGGNLTRLVDVNDFLTREIRVSFEGFSNEALDIITIRYHGYDEPIEIEPPSEYMSIPDEWLESGTAMGPPTVLGLARNEEGDIEMTFSEPVYVQGVVELYVLDTQTGGWVLPLIAGSGTDTLTFDADPEDRPPLIVGESRIGGLVFPAADSELKDSDGQWPILNFDPWMYE